MRICFDLDKTLCSGKPYIEAIPYPGVKDLLTRLKARGHTIIIYTARGMGTSKSNPGKAIAQIGKLTLNQLDSWGFIYDEIYFGKPSADIYVDDKAYHANDINRLETNLLKMEKSDMKIDDFSRRIDSMICKIDSCIKE
tara:strand:- start:15 stop:431 length:417 start_codon:yes stop_codon:yes gene_type:complete